MSELREHGEPTEEQTEEFPGALLDFDEFEWDDKAEANLTWARVGRRIRDRTA